MGRAKPEPRGVRVTPARGVLMPRMIPRAVTYLSRSSGASSSELSPTFSVAALLLVTLLTSLMAFGCQSSGGTSDDAGAADANGAVDGGLDGGLDVGLDGDVVDMGTVSADQGVDEGPVDLGPPATCQASVDPNAVDCTGTTCDATCDALDTGTCSLVCSGSDPESCTWECDAPSCTCADLAPATCTYAGPTCSATCSPPRCAVSCDDGQCVDSACPDCAASCDEAACSTRCNDVTECAAAFRCERRDAFCTTTCQPVTCTWVALDADAGVPDAGVVSCPTGGSVLRPVLDAVGMACDADAGTARWGIECTRPQCEINCFDGPYIECQTAECELDCDSPTCTVTCDTPACTATDGGVDCGEPTNCVTTCTCDVGRCTETRP